MNRAIWKYYYDVTRYNAGLSIALYLATSNVLHGILCLASGGMIFGLFCYKKLQNNQYYFYYNLGLTKTRLIITTWIFNLFIAALLALFFFLLQ